MSDIIKILLQAEVSKESIENIKSQLGKVQANTKPMKLEVDTKGVTGVKDMTSAFEKLEQVTKKNLMLDLDKMSNRYKNLIKSDDIANIKSMINSLNHTDPKLSHNIDLIKVKMKEVSIGAEQSRKSLDLANKSAVSFGDAIKQAAYKFGIWSGVTASYYKVIREISTGIKFITEMDSALNEIGMVTNQTREQTAGLVREYNNLAKEMKVLTREVTSGAVEFYRQGLSQEEVMERMRVTTMYSKVANVDFGQSAELLTATVNSMGVSIERAADVFLFLGDATATSGEEIGKGFSKTSGAAAALGVEFEKVASWIAVISSKTRESAESIGHSINTMLSRFSRLTETGFNEDDDTKINDVAKALNTVGISLTDQKGNFRDFGTIMDEINGKWNKLDDQTKSYIANTVAGTRQQSRFFNLMNGYAESMDLYTQSLEAAGTAQSKFNLYLESNQATIDKFRTTLEGLWLTVLDSDSLMSIVKTATSFIETLDSMIQKFGVLGSVATVVVPVIGIKYVTSITSATKATIAQELANKALGKSKISLINGFKLLIGQLFGAKVAADGATVSFMGLNAAAGILGIALVAIPLILSKIAQKSREAKEAMANAIDNSQRLNEEVKSLEDLAKKQEELTKVENKSVEQKEELLKVQRELAKLYPQLATGIDNEGNKIADNLEMTKQLTEEKRKLLEQELLVIKTTADTRLPELRKELAEMQDESKNIQDRITSGDVYEDIYDTYSGMIIGQIDITDKLKDRLLELVNAQKENYEETIKLEEGVKSYNQILGENAERQKWATAEELKNRAEKAQTKEQLELIEKGLKKLGFTSDDTAKIMSGNLDEVREKYKELDMQQIINLQTIENLDVTQKQTMINMLESSKQATKQLIEDTKSRIKAIQAEMEALIALTGGKAKNTSVVTRKNTREDLLDSSNSLLDTMTLIAQNKAVEANQELVELESNLANIEKALNNVSSINTRQISGTKDPKEKKKKEEYKAEADLYNKINLEIEKNSNLLAQNKIHQDLESNNLEKKISLLKEQIEFEKIHQNLLHQKANLYRQERASLEKPLSKQGFKFSGEGDARMITNLNHIKGKTKEVEEQFKRYQDIQSKEIPSLQQSWKEYLKSIEDVRLSITSLEFELADQSSQKLQKSLSDLEYQFKLIDETDINNKAKNISDQINILEKQVQGATAELEKLNNIGFKEGSKEAALYKQRQEELAKQVQEGTLAVQLQERALIDLREKMRTDYIARQNELADEQQKRLSALDQIQEKIVSIIRKRGEEEKKILDDTHKADMDSLERRHNERKKKWAEEVDLFKKMIQDKINALDEQYEEEDYLEQLNKEREEANRLQKEIDILSLDDSLTARNKTIELRKQLANQNEKIAKMQQKKERDLLKKSLQDQLKDKENEAKDKEDIANRTYENEKRRLEEDYQINKEYLDRKYSDEQVYAEARQAIMDNQVEVAKGQFIDIYDAFVDFEDKFGKGMGILGDIIKNDFIEQLELAQDAIDKMDYKASKLRRRYDSDYDATDEEIGWRNPRPRRQRQNRDTDTPRRPQEFRNWSNSDYQQYIQNKKDWERTTDEYGFDGRNNLRIKNALLRSKYWGASRMHEDKYHWKELEGYDKGGRVDFTAPIMVHGKENDPEWILRDHQLQKITSDSVKSTIATMMPDLLKNFNSSSFQDVIKSAISSRVNIPTPNLSNLMTRQGITLQIENFIKADSITKDSIPTLQKYENDAMSRLKNELNKYGVRPART